MEPFDLRNPTPTGPVPFWRLLCRGWGWLIVIAIPVVAILGTMVAYNGYVVARLAFEGVETTARITARQVRDADGDSRTDDREIHSLTFVFEADGQAVTGDMTVSEAFWNKTTPGSPLPLRYAHSAPHLHEIEPGAHKATLTGGSVGLALVLLVVGPVWRRRWRIASAMAWVRDHGEARTATVTRHENMKFEINNSTAYRLHWRDETGASGRTGLVGRHVRGRYPVGSEITLYIDPTGKRPRVWQAEVGAPVPRTGDA